jgi:hypothetical protein
MAMPEDASASEPGSIRLSTFTAHHKSPLQSPLSQKRCIYFVLASVFTNRNALFLSLSVDHLRYISSSFRATNLRTPPQLLPSLYNLGLQA